MNVICDLTFSIAPPGETAAQGTVRSQGRHITITLTDTRKTLDGFMGEFQVSRLNVQEVSRGLLRHGLTVCVIGPRGTVASVGAGIISPLGRLLAGSWRVRPGRLVALAPLVGHRLRHTRLPRGN